MVAGSPADIFEVNGVIRRDNKNASLLPCVSARFSLFEAFFYRADSMAHRFGIQVGCDISAQPCRSVGLEVGIAIQFCIDRDFLKELLGMLRATVTDNDKLSAPFVDFR